MQATAEATMTDGTDRTTPAVRSRWRRSVRWFAAEFLIVVTGVLAALAVGSWWESRQQRRMEQEYLTRLEHDLLATRTRVAAAVERGEQTSSQLRRFLVLAAGQDAGAKEDSLRAGLRYIMRLTPLVPLRATHQEMLSSGNVRVLSSDSLRIAMMRLDAALSFDAGFLAYAYAQYHTTVEPYIARRVPYSGFSHREDLVASPFTVVYSRLAEDPEMWNVVTLRMETEGDLARSRRRLLDDLDALLELVRSERERRAPVAAAAAS